MTADRIPAADLDAIGYELGTDENDVDSEQDRRVIRLVAAYRALADENETLRQVADAYTAEHRQSWQQRWSERFEQVAAECERAQMEAADLRRQLADMGEPEVEDALLGRRDGQSGFGLHTRIVRRSPWVPVGEKP